jgi:lipid-A-disaccharide synthase-like uncharacterized protein
VLRELLNPLVLFGLAGQIVFMLRFIVQWYVSERRGRSHVPSSFWYISCLGGLMLFTYAAIRHDAVFMLGQGLGVVIYVRNIMLIHRRAARYRRLIQARAYPAIAAEAAEVMHADPR